MKKYSGNHSVNSKKKHGVIRHSGLVICSILFILCSCMYFGMFRVSAKEIDQQRTSDAIEICYTSRLIEQVTAFGALQKKQLQTDMDP